jgi:multidrug efflux pump subunit AcrA (membrane-fusion protein)
VTSVSKVATTSTGVATYAVQVSFTGDPTKFFVGSNATASITTAQKANALLIPAQAITTTNGQSTVTVATAGTADGPTETRTVTTGGRSGALIEVTSGLQAGDKVVVEVPAGFANRTGEGGGGARTRTGGEGGFGGGGRNTGAGTGQGTGAGTGQGGGSQGG